MTASASSGTWERKKPPPSETSCGPDAGSPSTGGRERWMEFQPFSAVTTGYSESSAMLSAGGVFWARKVWNGCQSDSSVNEMMSSIRRSSGGPSSLTAFMA